MSETTEHPTLSEFLLERIGPEEALAHDAASEGTPHRTGWQLWTSKVDTTPGGERLGPRGSVEASPARVLAECEAKRRIVEMAEVAHERGIVSASPLFLALRYLAVPYADHPDYREEWRP